MNAILCFGDSITFGRGEQPAKGWCGRLKEWYESLDEYNAVYNLGIPGETSSGVLNRIKTELNSRVRYLRDGDTFTLILAIGTNDLSSNDVDSLVSLDEFKQNVLEIITYAQSKVDSVFVLQIPPSHSSLGSDWEESAYLNSDVDAYNDALKELAGENFVQLEFVDWDTKVPDGIHPNSNGYQDMFVQIRRLFS
jgi:lysophospholipase L1-like esterase